MPVNYLNSVLFRATSAGTGAFVPASAIQGYRIMSTANGAVVSDTYRYRAESDDLTQWEVGYGVWNGTNLTRIVTQNSAGNTSAINFTQAPRVGITELDLDYRRFAKLDENNTHTSGINIFNDATDATSASVGALRTLGGIAAAKNIWSGQNVVAARSLIANGLPAAYWNLDMSNTQVTIAQATNYVLAAGSGLLVINDLISGGVSAWLCGGGSVLMLGQAGADFTATVTYPGAYVWFNSGSYILTNNRTIGAITYGIAAIRTRTAV